LSQYYIKIINFGSYILKIEQNIIKNKIYMVRVFKQ